MNTVLVLHLWSFSPLPEHEEGRLFIQKQMLPPIMPYLIRTRSPQNGNSLRPHHTLRQLYLLH